MQKSRAIQCAYIRLRYRFLQRFIPASNDNVRDLQIIHAGRNIRFSLLAYNRVHCWMKPSIRCLNWQRCLKRTSGTSRRRWCLTSYRIARTAAMSKLVARQSLCRMFIVSDSFNKKPGVLPCPVCPVSHRFHSVSD